MLRYEYKTCSFTHNMNAKTSKTVEYLIHPLFNCGHNVI